MKIFLGLIFIFLTYFRSYGQTIATQTISTGYDRTNNVFYSQAYGQGTFDDFWDVTVTPISGSPVSASASIVTIPYSNPGFGWAPTFGNSLWVSYSSNSLTQSSLQTSATYSTTFSLFGAISNYSLHLEFTQDNLITSVLLNGQDITSFCTSAPGCSLQLNKGTNIIDVPACNNILQSDVNTLAFVVQDYQVIKTGFKMYGIIYSNTISNTAITYSPVEPCIETPVAFTLTPSPASVVWNFGDGVSSSTASHAYTSASTYTVTASYQIGLCPASTSSVTVTVGNCTALGCKDCIGSFAPIPGEQYVLSAWVRQDGSENEITYVKPAITISFTGSTATYPLLKAKGQIIDGWQRVEEVFTIPVSATKITINLLNVGAGTNEVYFDDIRIHPFKANMKSFVYDPITLRLSAELDANNYATYYEYDEDGALVRVKKETEKGISTIKETRNNNKK